METFPGCFTEEEALTRPGRPAQKGGKLGDEQTSYILLSLSGEMAFRYGSGRDLNVSVLPGSVGEQMGGKFLDFC